YPSLVGDQEEPFHTRISLAGTNLEPSHTCNLVATTKPALTSCARCHRRPLSRSARRSVPRSSPLRTSCAHTDHRGPHSSCGRSKPQPLPPASRLYCSDCS